MYDIISVGDPTIDHFFFIHDASTMCDVDKESCKLILNFADKLAVDNYSRFTAGNAMNHAISSSLLGLKTAYYAVTGDDSAGKEIAEALKKNKVSLQYLQKDKKNATNISAVISFKGERTIFVYHVAREYKLPISVKARWLYLTSAGPKEALPVLHKQILQVLKKNQSIKIAFNPGTHQMHLGTKALAPLFLHTEILFMNKEEYERVLEMEGRNIKQLLIAMHDLGPSVCVLTDGPNGSYVYDGEKFRYLQIYDTPVVERTGCGDAFGAAFTAAYVYGLGVGEAMRWGTMNSAYVIQKPGPQNGLLSKKQMLAILKKEKNFIPKEI